MTHNTSPQTHLAWTSSYGPSGRMRYFPLVGITNIPQDLSQEQLYEPEESPTSTCVVPKAVSSAVQHDGPRRIRRHHVLRHACGMFRLAEQREVRKASVRRGLCQIGSIYLRIIRVVYISFCSISPGAERLHLPCTRPCGNQ